MSTLISHPQRQLFLMSATTGVRSAATKIGNAWALPSDPASMSFSVPNDRDRLATSTEMAPPPPPHPGTPEPSAPTTAGSSATTPRLLQTLDSEKFRNAVGGTHSQSATNVLSTCFIQLRHDAWKSGLEGCSTRLRKGRTAAFDWSQQRVRDWYLENITQPTMKEGDGAWIDGDGPDNGAHECSGTHAYGSLKHPYPALNITSEIEAFCKGENAVVTAAQKHLIANKGYECQCIDFYNQKQLPTSADSGTQCTSKLLTLNTTVSNRVVALYGGRTGARWPSGGACTERTAAQAVAVFVLTRQDHWLFVLPNADRIPPGVATLVLSDFGAPLGSMVRNGSVFSRGHEKKTVSLDCANFTAAFD